MKKKTKATARRGAKRRKTVMAQRKVVRQLPSRASPPRLPVAPNGAKLTIRRLRTQLAKALARIEGLEASADTDFLLDIPNRRGFERELNRSIAYIKRYHASGALIVLDVDRLKPINDEFGHAAGDRVLKAIVAVLLRNVRSSDEIGRLGGDEFALLLWNMSETDAKAKAAVAGTSHRWLKLHLSRPYRDRGRVRWRCHSRPSRGNGPSAGTSRQRDVCAQGAKTPRSVMGRGKRSSAMPTLLRLSEFLWVRRALPTLRLLTLTTR